MVKGICPVCSKIVGLSPTRERQHPDRSSEWWLIDLHRDPAREAICEGSGKKL